MKKRELRTCGSCKELQSVTIKKPNHILHIILSLVTGGFWLIIYALIGFESLFKKKPKCVHCGSKIH